MKPGKPDAASGRADESRSVRAVPGLIAGISLVMLIAALLIAVNTGVSQGGSKQVSFGPFDLLFINNAPSLRMVAAGVLSAIGFTLLVHSLDAWAARRVTDPGWRPLRASGQPLGSAPSGRSAGRLSVTALIPACNEEVDLPTTLAALQRQTTPPDAVWVIADNCTDRTAEIARTMGASVYTTVDNRYRKAGGLNQLLTRLLPAMGPSPGARARFSC